MESAINVLSSNVLVLQEGNIFQTALCLHLSDDIFNVFPKLSIFAINNIKTYTCLCRGYRVKQCTGCFTFRYRGIIPQNFLPNKEQMSVTNNKIN